VTLLDLTPRTPLSTKVLKGHIGLKNVRIDCIIGIYEHERVREQPLYVDIKVRSAFAACASSDDIEDTLNYEQLLFLCRDVAKVGQFQLLETYATAVLNKLVREYQVEWASLVVRKPEAIAEAECAFVELEYGDRR
jgi:7,8-dihydroneopterin aldolase/epimerase/oxygenase